MNSRTASPGSRERLLTAAKTLMARDGYEQTTTAAIAREAGTSESQLVRYFENKPGLLEAVFEEAWVPLNAQVIEAVGRAGSGHEALLDILGIFLRRLQADPELATLMIFEGRRIRARTHNVVLSRGFLEFGETMMELIRRCQEERSIDPELNASALYAAIVGMSEGMLRDRMIERRAGHRADYNAEDIHRVFDAMLSGLRPAI